MTCTYSIGFRSARLILSPFVPYQSPEFPVRVCGYLDIQYFISPQERAWDVSQTHRNPGLCAAGKPRGFATSLFKFFIHLDADLLL